jgi:hypothetical protein
MIGRIDVERALDTDWGFHEHRGWIGRHSGIGWYGCRNEVSFFRLDSNG